VIGPLAARRWHRPRTDELDAVVRALEGWPAPAGGAVRHLLPLAAIDTGGVAVVRITGDARERTDDGTTLVGVAVRVGRDVLAVAGDARTIARAVGPTPTWRLLVGDASAADALLARGTRMHPSHVHDQRYLAVDADAVPGESGVPDPGVRAAEAADVEALADLAVRLHIDDGFGPDPGEGGRRGYRERLAVSVRSGVVDVVGPVGRPIAKLERSVDHPRYGVQLAGIVVAPEHRGRGIGRGLVAVAARRAIAGRRARGMAVPAVTLHTRAANTPAIVAYEAAGFRVVEPWRLALT
jgi:ribosomal protein S18 acetylase RimI-like enzyme